MVHLLHYPAVLSFQRWRWIFWVVFFGIWENRCYPRRLAFGKIFSRFLKIISRSCLHTEDPLPHLYGIEIPLHDDFLVPNLFNHKSKNHFQALSQPASIIPKENIFGCLLGNRASALYSFSFLIILHGSLNSFEIKTIVFIIVLIF